MSMSGTYIVVG